LIFKANNTLLFHQRPEVVETFESEDELVDVSLSPYICGEAIITTSQGDIHIWNQGKKSNIHNVPSPAPEEKWPWYQSTYGGHPKCIVVANPAEVNLFDIRVCTLILTYIIRINQSKSV